jgi:hypothetical protein
MHDSTTLKNSSSVLTAVSDSDGRTVLTDIGGYTPENDPSCARSAAERSPTGAAINSTFDHTCCWLRVFNRRGFHVKFAGKRLRGNEAWQGMLEIMLLERGFDVRNCTSELVCA